MLPSWMFSTNTSHNYQNLVTERTMCIKFYLLVHVHVHYQNYLKDIWKPVYILCKLVNKCWNAEKGYLKRNHLCWLVVLSQSVSTLQKQFQEQFHINYLFCMLPSWMFSTNTSHNYQNLVTERTMCIKFYLLVHVHVHYQNYLKDIWKPVYILCKLVNKCWNAEKGYLKRNHLCWLVVLSQCLWDF